MGGGAVGGEWSTKEEVNQGRTECMGVKVICKRTSRVMLSHY